MNNPVELEESVQTPQGSVPVSCDEKESIHSACGKFYFVIRIFNLCGADIEVILCLWKQYFARMRCQKDTCTHVYLMIPVVRLNYHMQSALWVMLKVEGGST